MNKIKTFFLTAILAVSMSVFSTSCGDGESSFNLEIPGVQGPDVQLYEDNVLVTVVFENLYTQGGLRYRIPKYVNSYIEVSPDLYSSGTLMAINISLQDIFGGTLESLDPQALPGGRPLPGVVGGRLPAVAFSIPQFYHMAFYLGPRVFGIWIPINNLNMQGSMLTARFYSDGVRTGNISLVGEDENGEYGGFLLLLDLGEKVKKKLKAVAKKYK